MSQKSANKAAWDRALQVQRWAWMAVPICCVGLLASQTHWTTLFAWWALALVICVGVGVYGQWRMRGLVDTAAPAPDKIRSDRASAAQLSAASPMRGTDPEFAADGARIMSLAAHDLRQPLQAIALFSATLTEHVLPVESARLAKGLEQASESLSTLFEAVVAHARALGGRLEYRRETVALEHVFARVFDELMSLAEERDIHLRRVMTGRAVWADSDQLERALTAIVRHAIDTTPVGGGVLLGCRRDASGWHIEIWDTGSPIPLEDLDGVLEPFSAYGKRLPDRGLGLGLAARLCADMGGSVSVGFVGTPRVAPGRTPVVRGKRLIVRMPVA